MKSEAFIQNEIRIALSPHAVDSEPMQANFGKGGGFILKNLNKWF